MGIGNWLWKRRKKEFRRPARRPSTPRPKARRLLLESLEPRQLLSGYPPMAPFQVNQLAAETPNPHPTGNQPSNTAELVPLASYTPATIFNPGVRGLQSYIICYTGMPWRLQIVRPKGPSMKRILLTLGLPLALTLLGCSAKPASDQATAIAEIRKMGGDVEVDEDRPGTPVIDVSFNNDVVGPFPSKGVSPRIPPKVTVTDAGLRYLEGFSQLRWLNLVRTRRDPRHGRWARAPRSVDPS